MWESEEIDLSQVPESVPEPPPEPPPAQETPPQNQDEGEDEAQEFSMGLAAKKMGMPELEPGTWIYDYVAVHEPLTDAPLQYHAAMAWGVLSCVLTGQFYLQFQGDKLNPNLWVLIIGPAGTSRKSTCLKFAKRVIAQTKSGIQLSERFSTEGLIMELEMLKDDGQKGGLSVLNEFSLLLTLLDRDFARYPRRPDPQFWTWAFCGCNSLEVFQPVFNVHPKGGQLSARLQDWNLPGLEDAFGI